MKEMRPSHDWITEILDLMGRALEENDAFWIKFKQEWAEMEERYA